MTAETEILRCGWTGLTKLMQRYHDTEWGVPVHDDQKHFEFLMLEGAQAGLSWEIVLRKRAAYRAAFAGFEADRVARFDERDVERLLGDAGIIRNHLKIRGAITNARQFLEIQRELGSFDRYIWEFVGGVPVQSQRSSLAELPATSPESDALSQDLKRRGFKFVGSTICYAHMQAAGLVNDHTIDCFRHAEVRALSLS